MHARCFAEVRTGGRSNCDVDNIFPVSLGGNNGIDNLQILCVEDHRRKSSFERQGVLGYPVGPGIKLEQCIVYIARSGITAMSTEVLSKTVKQALREPDGIFKPV